MNNGEELSRAGRRPPRENPGAPSRERVRDCDAGRDRSGAMREVGRELLQILDESGDLREASRRILATLRERMGFDAAAIRVQDGEDFPYFAQEGFPEDFLILENRLTAPAPGGGICRDEDGRARLDCTCGLVLSGRTDPGHPLFTPGGSFWTNDSLPLLDLSPAEDPRHHPRNECIHRGFASVALVPIRNQGRIVGLVQLNDHRQGRFTLETIEALEGIALHIGAALIRKQTDDTLRAREAVLRGIRDNVQDAYLRTGLDMRLVMVSPSAARLFGYRSTGDMIGLPVEALYADPAEHQVMYGQLTESGGVADYIVQGRKVDGETFWASLSAQAYRDDQGSVAGIEGFVRDITERRRAEEDLKRSHDLLEKLARLVPGVIYQFRLDPDGRSAFPYASPGMNDIYGVTPEEVREDATPVEREHDN